MTNLYSRRFPRTGGADLTSLGNDNPLVDFRKAVPEPESKMEGISQDFGQAIDDCYESSPRFTFLFDVPGPLRAQELHISVPYSHLPLHGTADHQEDSVHRS